MEDHLGRYWLGISDLTIFEAAFWMATGNDPDQLEYDPTFKDGLSDHSPDWSKDVCEESKVIASAIRAGSIKTTEEDCRDDKSFDINHTRINKSGWLKWCSSNGYSELADRFKTPAVDVESNNDDVAPAADAEQYNDETLPALFDPVTVEVLEKMFPADGKWKDWAERAARNGLETARSGRAMFNPYGAAMWFLQKGVQGWDLARCHRTLANNLPARSLDNRSMLTGNLDYPSRGRR